MIAESGSAEMAALLGGSTVLASVEIAYVELRAALAAAAGDGRLEGAGYLAARAGVDQVWESTSRLSVDSDLVLDAAELAERMSLRGYDAVHLAGLVRLGLPELVSFACWDANLRSAATSMGYQLHPA